MLSNTSDEEIIHISIRDDHLSERQIEKFKEKNEYPKKERWAIEFDHHGGSQIEEAAKKFIEEVNKSFNNTSNQ
ncbi:MAG: hypothetical protein WBZ36_25880 [Candidatus Nitrosopolaris sp.]